MTEPQEPQNEPYFFDSYAIIEVFLGNRDYKKYINVPYVLTKLNLFEIYYNIAKDFGEKKADDVLQKHSPSAIEYGEEIIKEAAKFRLLHKKQDLSMTDCIGYIIAKKLSIRFLTGDKEFQDLPNVEFVK